MKLSTKFKMPTPEQVRDFKRNLQGRYQLFLVLFKWDRVYQREVVVTALAFFLINYSILDLDNPFDWVALLIEGIIMWVQVGNEFSILPKEYRPHQNGVSFGAHIVQAITHNRNTVNFDEILAPKAEDKLKMYNPILGKELNKETPLCSDVLNDHLMSVKKLPYTLSYKSDNYICSVHQIRYLAIRVANKKQHTTNEDKICMNGGFDALMNDKPLELQKTNYFNGLLTCEAFRSQIICENLRGQAEVNTDLTQYYPIVEDTIKNKSVLRLPDEYYKSVSGHFGATSLILTENRKIMMLFQGAAKAVDANKINLGGAGSVDITDANPNGGQDVRRLIRRSMAREASEETGLMREYNEIYENTMLTGVFHWMDRGAKPEFTGITKAGSLKFMDDENIDGDEIIKVRELPVVINDVKDFKKAWDFAMKEKLNLSLSSLMALHRLKVIAGYNSVKATKAQKQIYKDMQRFLFA